MRKLNKIFRGCVGTKLHRTPKATHLRGKSGCNNDGIVPIVLVHGGAGAVPEKKVDCILVGVKTAAKKGYKALKDKGNVLDAVEQAVRSLEEDINFNAGHGSALTKDGKVEMDASIMDGCELTAGCVSLVRNIVHPISLARCVMEKTRHTYLAGDGAMRLAESEKFEILSDNALITDESKEALKTLKDKKKKKKDKGPSGPPGTVGAVAIDVYGNLAAATSTGGLTGKLSGRIGDSPLLGCGTYADNETGAVSATGHGESIMRLSAASRILALVRYEQLSAQQAAEQVMKDLSTRFNQEAGIIAIDHRGKVGIYFTTSMSWAYQRGEELHYGIKAGEDHSETICD